METTVSADGTTIAFERVGEGPPLVLVGGALSDRRAGADLAALLAADLTVVSYDRRGRGDSGDTPPYAVEREVDDLAAVIGSVGGSAFVFGHSSGAVLALEATGRGIGVSRLALYEPPFIVDDSRPPLPEDYVARLEELIAAGERGEAVAHFMRVGPGVPEDMLEGMRSLPMWAQMEALAHTLPYDVRVMGDTAFGRPLPAGRWSGVAVPTLVMDGGASPAWQHAAAHALADALPDATQRTLEGQTHGFDPGPMAAELRAFFSGGG
jgi:pimeloyl-ACP methyl ester carboxylesterase